MGDDERLTAIVQEIITEIQEEDAIIRSEQSYLVVAGRAAELAKRLLLQGGEFDSAS
jgi:hypothetical protein